MSEVINRAIRCEKLLKDEDLQQAFTDIRNEILRRFEAAPIADRDTVHELKLMLHLLSSLRANFEEAVKAGRLEEFRLQQEKKGAFLGDLWNKRRKLK